MAVIMTLSWHRLAFISLLEGVSVQGGFKWRQEGSQAHWGDNPYRNAWEVLSTCSRKGFTKLGESSAPHGSTERGMWAPLLPFWQFFYLSLSLREKETGLLKIRESPLEVQALILPKGFMLHVHTPAGIGIICAIQTKWPEHWMPFLPWKSWNGKTSRFSNVSYEGALCSTGGKTCVPATASCKPLSLGSLWQPWINQTGILSTVDAWQPLSRPQACLWRCLLSSTWPSKASFVCGNTEWATVKPAKDINWSARAFEHQCIHKTASLPQFCWSIFKETIAKAYSAAAASAGLCSASGKGFMAAEIVLSIFTWEYVFLRTTNTRRVFLTQHCPICCSESKNSLSFSAINSNPRRHRWLIAREKAITFSRNRI